MKELLFALFFFWGGIVLVGWDIKNSCLVSGEYSTLFVKIDCEVIE